MKRSKEVSIIVDALKKEGLLPEKVEKVRLVINSAIKERNRQEHNERTERKQRESSWRHQNWKKKREQKALKKLQNLQKDAENNVKCLLEGRNVDDK